MSVSLHHLLMQTHTKFQKLLFGSLDGTLTLGQPKILDHLREHDGDIQKDIAAACCIEQPSLTSILSGMEKNGLIVRKTADGNRRSLYVYLTDKGREYSEKIGSDFLHIENKAFEGFTEAEKKNLIDYLTRINENISRKKDTNE